MHEVCGGCEVIEYGDFVPEIWFGVTRDFRQVAHANFDEKRDGQTDRDT